MEIKDINFKDINAELRYIYFYHSKETKNSQILKLLEELGELIIAVSKNDRDNFVEELADVSILMLQLYKFKLTKSDKLKFWDNFNYKIEREIKRIQEVNDR